MRSITQALFAASLIAWPSTPITAQRSSDDGESGDRDALRALVWLQGAHSASPIGLVSPAFPDWICAVHRLNPNKRDDSQDWKISYLTNCSASTISAVAFGGARSVRSHGEWGFRFVTASGMGALNRPGEGGQGENEGGASSNNTSVPGAGSSANANRVTGGSSSGSSNAGMSAAGSGNTAAITATITTAEPSTILLVSSGLAMLGAGAFRRRRS